MIDRSAVVSTVRRFLRPMVRLMTRQGINARDFIEIVKMVYAEVALREGGDQGQAATLSRAARITGLTRREITRLHGVLEKVPLDTEVLRAPAERVLEAWHSDQRFVARDGHPLPLDRTGSFAELINAHRGVLSASTLIAELEAHRLIRITGDDVTVQCRYVPWDSVGSSVAERLGYLVEAIGTRMSSKPATDSMDGGLLEGCYVSEQRVTVSADEVGKYMDRQAAELLERLDEGACGQIESDVPAGSRLRIGIYAMLEQSGIPRPATHKDRRP